MAGVTATALLLFQADRIVTSRVLPLETFGYYMLGATLANALLYTFVSPVYASVFPRLSSLVALGDTATLQASYRRAWGVMSVIAVPAAAVLCLFAHPLILVWTRDPVAATATAPIAALLVGGMALHGLLLIPFGLQLAHGWTRVALIINASLCAVALPLVLLLALRFGAVGAAATWPIVNVLFAVATITITHGRLGAETGRGWLVADIAWPAGAAIAVTALCRAAIPVPATFPGVIAVAAVAWAGTTATLVALSPLLRHNAADLVTRMRNRRRTA
jgi:O-antigen/teichoic acid export membrane protein